MSRKCSCFDTHIALVGDLIYGINILVWPKALGPGPSQNKGLKQNVS